MNSILTTQIPFVKCMAPVLHGTCVARTCVARTCVARTCVAAFKLFFTPHGRLQFVQRYHPRGSRSDSVQPPSWFSGPPSLSGNPSTYSKSEANSIHRGKPCRFQRSPRLAFVISTLTCNFFRVKMSPAGRTYRNPRLHPVSPRVTRENRRRRRQ